MVCSAAILRSFFLYFFAHAFRSYLYYFFAHIACYMIGRRGAIVPIKYHVNTDYFVDVSDVPFEKIARPAALR